MDSLFNLLFVICVGAIFFGKIWLIIIIARGSPIAALLCLVIPFLVLFFLSEHWDEAKPAVMTWASGIIGVILCAIASSLSS